MYGIRAPLDAGSYYNLLYQEGIRGELLDFLGNQYGFQPGAIVLGLHEGEPIERVNRDVDWNYSVSQEMTREIGDIYLLVFAAVALRHFEQYDHRTPYMEEVRTFLESLQQDGYTYHNGYMYDANGAAVVPVPLGGVVAVSQPPVAQKEVPQTAIEPSSQPADPGSSVTEPAMMKVGRRDKPARKTWSIEAKIALWVLIVGIATLIATVASPEVRTFFHLDKSSSVSLDRKPTASASQADTNPRTQPGAAPPQKSTPTNPSAGTGDARPIEESPKLQAHRVKVADQDGSPIKGVELLFIRQNGVHSSIAASDENGIAEMATLDENGGLFCARDGFFSNYGKYNPSAPLTITLKKSANGGSVIIADGTGYIPNLSGRLNPILDTLARIFMPRISLLTAGSLNQSILFLTRL
jgi:hypothetical protein